jgi:hypothetical protein
MYDGCGWWVACDELHNSNNVLNSQRIMNMAVSFTEIKITLAPPWTEKTFQSVAVVPGAKTVVTRLRAGKKGCLEAEKFALGEEAVQGLCMKLGSETESFLNEVD